MPVLTKLDFNFYTKTSIRILLTNFLFCFLLTKVE